MIHGIVPYDYGDFPLEILSIYAISITILFSQHNIRQILITLLALIIVIFVEIPIISKASWKAMLFEQFLAIKFNLLALISVSMIFTQKR